MKSLPNSVRKKMDEAKLAIIMTKSEIKAEREELENPNLTVLEEVCKRQRILALRKHLGKVKAFVKVIKNKYKSLR